jgi:hypothetical protein
MAVADSDDCASEGKSCTTIAPASTPEPPTPTETGRLSIEIVQPLEPTPATTIDELDWSDGIDMNFVQTTYFSCVTRGTYSHCGWHRPILDAGAGRMTAGPGIAVRAGLAAGAVGMVVAAW